MSTILTLLPTVLRILAAIFVLRYAWCLLGINTQIPTLWAIYSNLPARERAWGMLKSYLEWFAPTRPFYLAVDLIRTKAPYTLGEKTFMILIDFLIMKVTLAILLPLEALWTPQGIYRPIEIWTYGQLRGLIGDIELSDKIVDWQEQGQEEVNE